MFGLLGEEQTTLQDFEWDNTLVGPGGIYGQNPHLRPKWSAPSKNACHWSLIIFKLKKVSYVVGIPDWRGTESESELESPGVVATC